MTRVRQDVDGGLDLGGAATEEVIYTYDSKPVATGNFSRVASTTFPDGENFSHEFSTGIDSDISRISGFFLSSDLSPLVEYSYLGLGTAAVVDYPIPDVQLDFTLASDGSRNLIGLGTSGLYPGFDRLGRVVRQTWAHGNLATGSPGLPDRPPHVERLYGYDKASNRLLNADGRPGQMVADRDFEYLYDGLYRAEEVQRGLWDGSAITPAAGGRLWDLDVLGNWEQRTTDGNGNGLYTDGLADLFDNRTHNDANEVLTRSLTGGGGSGSQTIAWDPAGQLRDKGAFTYTHDAWGRLVRAEIGGGSPIVVGRYEYFGTHWRSVRERDTTLPRDGLDERRHLYYGIDWKLCEEHVDQGWAGGAHTTDVVAQNFWGTRHIDDSVMRRRRDEPGDWTNDQLTRTYYLTDVQFSTLALIHDNALLAERVLYNAYGEGEHRWRRDIDGDGDVDTADGNAINAAVGTVIGDPNYNVDADLDLDGDVDFADVLVTGTGPQPKLTGEISSPGIDNIIGFDGYCYDNETTLYSVRHRCYDPDLGRFIQRDPGRYADGMSLYEYVKSRPFVLMDPMGLDSQYYITPQAGDVTYSQVTGQGKTFYLQNTWTAGRGGQLNLSRQRFEGGMMIDPDNGISVDKAYHNQQYGIGEDSYSRRVREQRETYDEFRDTALEEVKNACKDTYGPLAMATGGGAISLGTAKRFGDDAFEAAGKGMKRLLDDGSDAAETAYDSFYLFKKAKGPAGEGKQWHHIVEQNKHKQFGARAINSVDNLVAIDRDIHKQISDFYSSKRSFTEGQTVRKWLSGQSFEEQRAFGLQTMRDFGAGQ